MYACEIPDCDRKVAIRSTIKSGEFKGKKVCGICKQKIDKPVKTARKPIKKFSEKSLEKRKVKRSGYKEFFEKAIRVSKPVCENCGSSVNLGFNPSWNIAHILSKRNYPSVATNPENYLVLCAGAKDNADGHSCHSEFDSGNNTRVKMQAYKKALKKYALFKSEVLEAGSEKTLLDAGLAVVNIKGIEL